MPEHKSRKEKFGSVMIAQTKVAFGIKHVIKLLENDYLFEKTFRFCCKT